ncbi:TetR family transcriptional regulator [Streptomyces bingchenggensis BCW-1]|uniref:TetR family transcriptional regulator n=1 Tax=Streptomyces bingchenggensis (strain BCW-1) TaxID=749414 RepID=D7C9H6_STRBB|nr:MULTISPECIES: helix-turn-helix domain-containing protein [Streptomyces]ADI12688.1 TetR family transcriptional regulator [Streptomyces bingchenggensis BCW-1]
MAGGPAVRAYGGGGGPAGHAGRCSRGALPLLRERIVKAAAELIYEHGAQNTNNEQIRAAAGVSGSQLTRHFPTKESLVRAVLAWQADGIVARHQAPERPPTGTRWPMASSGDRNCSSAA